MGDALFIFLASLLWWRYHQRSRRRQLQASSRGDIDKDTPSKAAEGTNIGGFNRSHERPPPSHPRTLPWNAPIPTPYTKHSAYDGSTSPLLSRAYRDPDTPKTTNTPNMHHPSSSSSSMGYAIPSSSSEYSTATSSRGPAIQFPSMPNVIELPEKRPPEVILTVSGSYSNFPSVYQLPAGAAPPTKTGWYEDQIPGPSTVTQPVVRQADNTQELPPPYIGGSNRLLDEGDKKRRE